jgi:hypothetical protein
MIAYHGVQDRFGRTTGPIGSGESSHEAAQLAVSVPAPSPDIGARFSLRTGVQDDLSRAPLSREVLARLRRGSGWEWEWVGALRRGPSTLVGVPGYVVSTWCSLLTASGETWLDLGVGLHVHCTRCRSDLEAQRRGRGTLLAALPHGYSEIKFQRRRGQPPGYMMIKGGSGVSPTRLGARTP